MYVIEAIIIDKTEYLSNCFIENKGIFIEIQSHYSSNKKIQSIINGILNENKEKARPSYKYEIRTNSSLHDECSSNAESDKNSTLSNENKQQASQAQTKFSFIKKKQTENANEVKESNNGSADLFFNLVIKDKEPTNAGFSFIKSKKDTNNKQVKSNTIDLLSSELSEVLSMPMNNTEMASLNDFSRQMNKQEVETNQVPHETGDHILLQMEVPKKYIPPNFDLLFDPKLMHEKGSLITPGESNPEQNEECLPKKDHFDFVNDLLRKR